MAALTALIVFLSQFAAIQLVPVDSAAFGLDEDAQRIDENLENFSQRTTNPDAEVFEVTADDESDLRAKRQLSDNEFDEQLFSTSADDDDDNNIGVTTKAPIGAAKTTPRDQLPNVKPVTATRMTANTVTATFKSIQTSGQHGTARPGAITSPGTRTTKKAGIPSLRPSTLRPSARNGFDGVRTTQKNVGSVFFPMK